MRTPNDRHMEMKEVKSRRRVQAKRREKERRPRDRVARGVEGLCESTLRWICGGAWRRSVAAVTNHTRLSFQAHRHHRHRRAASTHCTAAALPAIANPDRPIDAGGIDRRGLEFRQTSHRTDKPRSRSTGATVRRSQQVRTARSFPRVVLVFGNASVDPTPESTTPEDSAIRHTRAGGWVVPEVQLWPVDWSAAALAKHLQGMARRHHPPTIFFLHPGPIVDRPDSEKNEKRLVVAVDAKLTRRRCLRRITHAGCGKRR
ncbi:hypothetical protein BJ912DRAFT_1056170 [Pholiota molesta]|nr:hypothetical protein BJ912DRAFT_1056170 [Pholiota molesta]